MTTKNSIITLRDWQRDCFNTHKDARYLAIQAFCGAGKTKLQVALIAHDVRSSGFRQKQLVTVPQSHIGSGFVEPCRMQVGRRKEDWNVPAANVFIDGRTGVLEDLYDWLVAPAPITTNIGDLVAVCTHTALGLVWQMLEENMEEDRAIQHLTLRADESHHVSNVHEERDLSPEDAAFLNSEATHLGRACTYILNSKVRTSKIHFTTATPFRGDRKSIIALDSKNRRWEEYALPFMDYWKMLEIEDYAIKYTTYPKGTDPIKQVMDNIKASPKSDKHLVVIPPSNIQWRANTGYETLLKKLQRHFGKDNVLDLVPQEHQEERKAKLLAEPKDSKRGSKFKCVISCNLVREGTDWVPCSILHNTTVEGSMTMAVQTGGRILRKCAGKKKVTAFYYIPDFGEPKKGMTSRDLLSDRTNMYLVAMQWQDMFTPLKFPAFPSEKKRKDKKKKKSSTLGEYFEGNEGEARKVKEELLEGYEALSNKSPKSVEKHIEKIMKAHKVKPEDREAMAEVLKKLLNRAKAVKNNFHSSYLRDNGVDGLKQDSESLYFGDYDGDYFEEIQKVVRSDEQYHIDRLASVLENNSGMPMKGTPDHAWLQNQKEAKAAFEGRKFNYKVCTWYPVIGDLAKGTWVEAALEYRSSHEQKAINTLHEFHAEGFSLDNMPPRGHRLYNWVKSFRTARNNPSYRGAWYPVLDKIAESLGLGGLFSDPMRNAFQPKLSASDVKTIRKMHKTGMSFRSLGEKFGVDKCTISSVVNKTNGYRS